MTSPGPAKGPPGWGAAGRGRPRLRRNRRARQRQAGEAMRGHVAEYATYAKRKFPVALDQLIKW